MKCFPDESPLSENNQAVGIPHLTATDYEMTAEYYCHDAYCACEVCREPAPRYLCLRCGRTDDCLCA